MSFKDDLLKDYENMLALRKTLGYTGNRHPQAVVRFIMFCIENYPEHSSITKQMLDEWLQTHSFKTRATHNFAISGIRGFTKYLASLGKEAFIPGSEYSVRVERYAPYIFTDDELKKLFGAFDSVLPNHQMPNREYIIPVLFRMMYCCGMRPSEPTKLLCEDVDLDTGEVYIRQAKGRSDRRIVMSDDLLALCRKYSRSVYRAKYFFERKDGGIFCADWVTNQFQFCWRDSGLVKRGNPRPYDLRHNFATRTMLRWLNEGKDLNAMAAYLSAYMGHTEFSATLYYINLLPEMLKSSTGIDWARFSRIYPEVSHEND